MIVVGADGSAPGRVALRWSAERAAKTGDELLLVHVLDDEWGMVSARLIDELRTDAHALLARESDFARSLEPAIAIRSELLEGSPMWRLVEASVHAALVVVGTHKTGFVRGRVIGSSSLQLAAAARAPVIVVPESWNRTRAGIVVGVDRSRAGRAAIRFAAAEAARADRELCLIRAWSTKALRRTDRDAESLENALLQPELDSELDSVLAEAIALAEEGNERLTIRTRRVQRATAEVLIDATATAELVVLGSSRRQAAPATLGSVTHDVLLNLAGPVAVLHADDADEPPATE